MSHLSNNQIIKPETILPTKVANINSKTVHCIALITLYVTNLFNTTNLCGNMVVVR